MYIYIRLNILKLKQLELDYVYCKTTKNLIDPQL